MKPTIFPALRYKDAPAALEWLCRAFLFEKQAVFPAADTVDLCSEIGLRPIKKTQVFAQLRRGA